MSRRDSHRYSHRESHRPTQPNPTQRNIASLVPSCPVTFTSAEKREDTRESAAKLAVASSSSIKKCPYFSAVPENPTRAALLTTDRARGSARPAATRKRTAPIMSSLMVAYVMKACHCTPDRMPCTFCWRWSIPPRFCACCGAVLRRLASVEAGRCLECRLRGEGQGCETG